MKKKAVSKTEDKKGEMGNRQDWVSHIQHLLKKGKVVQELRFRELLLQSQHGYFRVLDRHSQVVENMPRVEERANPLSPLPSLPYTL